MDNPSSRKLPPIDQNQRADSQPKSGLRPQMISSNNYQPSGVAKKTGPATMEEIDNIVCYFCGGADCKKEQASSNKNKNAIDGLHSDWITDNILAMQRLSTKLMDIVVPQFRINNIGAVISLQQQGEHAQCGPPLIPSVGFTYDPEVLQSARISFFNYGWEDMTAETDVANLLRICSAFEMCLKKGQKVAVHCHAGTGRTGVAIVSWLIYGEGMTADEGIKLFQSRRRDSLGKTSQRDLLRNFEKFLSNRKWFDYQKISGLKNDDIVQQQNKLVVGETRNQLKYLPAPFQVVLKRFATLLESSLLTGKQIMDAIVGDPQKLSPLDNQELQKLKQQFNHHNYRIGHITDLRILAQLMFDYFNQLPWQCLADKIVFLIKPHLNDKTITEILKLVIKDLEIYTFTILKSIVQFAVLLKNTDPQINLKTLFYRFGISLLQKQSYLDEHFVGHALVRLDKIEIVQIVYLSQFLLKWVEESKTEQLFEENQLSKEMRTLLK